MLPISGMLIMGQKTPTNKMTAPDKPISFRKSATVELPTSFPGERSSLPGKSDLQCLQIIASSCISSAQNGHFIIITPLQLIDSVTGNFSDAKKPGLNILWIVRRPGCLVETL